MEITLVLLFAILMTQVLRPRTEPNVTQEPRTFGIIGYPIAHSLSPLLYQTAFRSLGLPYTYSAHAVHPSELEQKLQKLAENGISGFNVTIPHKESILPLLAEVEAEARAIGAVNTVVVQNESLIGYNTDALGVERSLAPYRRDITRQRILVLGAGGSARAVVRVLAKRFQPSHLVIATRTLDRAHRLAGETRATFPELPVVVKSISDPAIFRIVEESSLIINATSVGMSPEVLASPLPAGTPLHERQIVFDLIYRPLETTLLRRAAERGARTIQGMEMLLQQAAGSFELWTGRQMPLEAVRHELVENARNEGVKGE